MNVYDFDLTIFHPYSISSFVFFCMHRHPKLYFKYFPKVLKSGFGYIFGKQSKNHVSAKFFSIVRYLDNPDEDIALYWKKYEKNISSWYLKQKRSDDLVISASPEYLLKPICDKLGINLVGTIVDKESGVMIGNVRLAREKAKYIIDQDMPLIENFYSDSLRDTPAALLAEHAYLVKDHAQTVVPWPHINEAYTKKVKKKLSIGKRGDK